MPRLILRHFLFCILSRSIQFYGIQVSEYFLSTYHTLGVVKEGKSHSFINYLLHAHYEPATVLQPENAVMQEA